MRLEELSKTELISFMQNYIEVYESDDIQCAICGDTDREFYYICDKCASGL